MSARSRSVVAALALALGLGAGCGPRPAPPTAPRSPPPLSREGAAAIALAVQQLRGLPERSPIALEQLDEKTFQSAIGRRLFGFSAEGDERMQAALTFADPAAPQDDGLQHAMHSSIVGFYEGDSKKVYLKSSAVASSTERMLERLTVAHEVQHALQAQHFGSINVATVLDEDSRLARLALIEGDADITGLSYLAWEQNIRPERPIARVLRLVRTLPTEQVLDRDNAALHQLAAVDRERMVFPYVAGDAFAADLYRAGGFELVNRAFAHPPSTTEQVLHPARYVAGERAVVVHAPLPPAGTKTLATGRMGELQTRALLLACTGWDGAVRAAEGWGGDAFTIVATVPGERALLWATTWDSEADAADFEGALLAGAACLPGLSGEGMAPRANVPTLVRRAGRHVALVRGLRAEELAPAAETLLALPEAPLPPEPPLGPVQLRPLPVPPSRWPGSFQGQVYTSGWLGITTLMPPSYTGKTASDGLELVIDGPGAAGGMVFVSDRVVSPRSNGAVFDDVAAAFTEDTRIKLDVIETNAYRIPLGDVMLRRWSVRRTQVQIEVAILPICGGAGSLAFLRTWANPYDKTTLDTWFLSFRALEPNPPVCLDLVP